MSDYYEYDEYEQYEPTEIKGLEEAIKAEASAIVDVESIRVLIRQYITDNFHGIIKNIIQQEVISCLKKAYNNKANFQESIDKVMADRFDRKYPDIVENRIDELAEEIKKYNFKWQNNRSTNSIKEKAMEKVNEYIDNELAKEVQKTTDYLEQYSRNYFANNLFRAMGMMDKLLPQANFDKDNS